RPAVHLRQRRLQGLVVDDRDVALGQLLEALRHLLEAAGQFLGAAAGKLFRTTLDLLGALADLIGRLLGLALFGSSATPCRRDAENERRHHRSCLHVIPPERPLPAGANLSTRACGRREAFRLTGRRPVWTCFPPRRRTTVVPGRSCPE